VSDAQDRAFMDCAIEVGRQARYWSAPNPPVGCVLVRDGQILGSGFTQPDGDAHAEIMALRAIERANSATAYVTLEPCSHEGRTGPCVSALIEAGISRAVIAVQDPNPEVSGRGIAALREAGIQVDVGIGAEQAEEDLAGFLMRMRRGHGRITLKIAASLDGRTAMASGESQWITGELARQDVQRLRAESDLIVTGIGTVLADDCRLTLRGEALPLDTEAKARALAYPPARMVLDSQARIPSDARVLQGATTTVVTTQPSSLSDRVRVCRLSADDAGRVDFAAWISLLGEERYNEILVEAGLTLSGALVQAGWVDRLIIYQAPTLLGDGARGMTGLMLDHLSDAISLHFKEVTRLGPDLRIIATPTSRRAV
jgi:diaminohydroxyphosphoribosylaminopyrimidine deaminase/5-amino-6-(5-phosphoribosylamino)uracil reductase